MRELSESNHLPQPIETRGHRVLHDDRSDSKGKTAHVTLGRIFTQTRAENHEVPGDAWRDGENYQKRGRRAGAHSKSEWNNAEHRERFRRVPAVVRGGELREQFEITVAELEWGRC